MNLLIDTEAFIYATTRPEKLPRRAMDAMRSRENTLYLSVVSPWEMQIKYDLKKDFELRLPPVPLVQSELTDGTFTLLPVTLAHITALAGLPRHHRDPFDRLLIAQALHERLTLVTGDEKVARYAVPTLWR